MATCSVGMRLVGESVVNGAAHSRYCAPWPAVTTWKVEAATPAMTIGLARRHHQIATATRSSVPIEPTRPSTAHSVEVSKLSLVYGKKTKITDDQPQVPPAGL